MGELASTEETVLVQRCRRGEPAAVRLLIDRHVRSAFGFTLSLLGCAPNQARDVALAGFADALLAIRTRGGSGTFRHALVPALVDRARRSGAPLADGVPEGLAATGPKRELLRMVRQALGLLPFDARLALLLRDQLHLPYEEIGVIAGTGAKQARADTIAARTLLREKLRDLAARPGGA